MPSAITGWASPAILPVKIDAVLRGARGCPDGSGRWKGSCPPASHRPAPRCTPVVVSRICASTASAALPPWRARAARQRIAPDAAGQRGAARIAMHQPAIAAGKGQQRHQPGRQRAAGEMRLEGEQVGRRGASSGTAKTPLAFHEPQAAITVRAAMLAAIVQGADRCHRRRARSAVTSAGCEQLRARRHRGIAQHQVQMLAPQRPAPGLFARRRQHRLAGIDADPRHRRPGGGNERRGDAAILQHRHGGGGDEFAAHLAAGKFRLLHQRHAPAGLGQQPRRRRAGGTGADDQRVIAAWACEDMGEGKDAALAQPPGAALRPQRRQFPVAETGAHAGHRIMAGDVIGAQRKHQPRAQQARKPERRGSQATKPLARAATSASSRASAASSK